jgi:hypothetical protein
MLPFPSLFLFLISLPNKTLPTIPLLVLYLTPPDMLSPFSYHVLLFLSSLWAGSPPPSITTTTRTSCFKIKNQM